MGWEVCQFEETVPIGVQAEDENAPGANVGAFGHGVRGATAQVLLPSTLYMYLYGVRVHST